METVTSDDPQAANPSMSAVQTARELRFMEMPFFVIRFRMHSCPEIWRKFDAGGVFRATT